MPVPDAAHSTDKIPVLLLKTRSSLTDAYEDTLKCYVPDGGDIIGGGYEPCFVPVLQHRFNTHGLSTIKSLLRDQKISSSAHGAEYGGMIFTSQRAVEAFAHQVQGSKEGSAQWAHLRSVPIYSVGPATTRALSAITQPGRDAQPLQIFGEHTGNGESLAHFILSHYSTWYQDRDGQPLPPLLFLVGEQRRDIIPRLLMDEKTLSATQRIRVDEVVVYETGEMESFPADFERIIQETSRQQPSQVRWVVIFSGTGCDSMLQRLGWLDPNTGKVDPARRDHNTFIATIGPTTRAHLLDHFGFEPDVSAKSPSPAGVLQALLGFRSRRNEKAGLQHQLQPATSPQAHSPSPPGSLCTLKQEER